MHLIEHLKEIITLIVLTILFLAFASVSFSQSAEQQLVTCDSLLNNKIMQVFILKKVLKERENEIINLNVANENLNNKINQHNEKLKNSQEKFKIDIN